ncbi:MAG: zinc-ribbon domain-containing protein [Ruminococcus sp.]
MSFFDKLGKTISDTTHSVVEKTKSSTDTIRLNGLISDEERLINAAYLNMGKKYAELHSGDAEPEFRNSSAPSLPARKDQRLSEQIRKNKHLLICQSCGAEIPETVLFCTKCGAENPVGKRLAEERAAKEAAERAQREAEAAARQAAAQQNAQPQYTYTQPPVSGEICPSCGKPRTAGAMFCTFCGSRFVSAEPTAPAAPVTPAEPVPAPAAPEMPAAQPTEPEVTYAPEETPAAPETAASIPHRRQNPFRLPLRQHPAEPVRPAASPFRTATVSVPAAAQR